MTRNHDREHEAKYEARHEKKQVKSHLDIAMEKAAAMAHGAPGAEHAKPPEMRVTEEELKSLREKAAKADDYYDRLLRTAADLENYKKRAERERSDLLKFGQEDLMAELIIVLDNFGRALDSAGNSAAPKAMAEGVSLIRKQLLSVLDKFGLSPIEAVGKNFNPALHEAVAQIETDAQPEGTVVGEQLRGYTLNKRLLRPAMVTVAAPPKSADAGTAAS